jgi:hypothetical protein
MTSRCILDLRLWQRIPERRVQLGKVHINDMGRILLMEGIHRQNSNGRPAVPLAKIGDRMDRLRLTYPFILLFEFGGRDVLGLGAAPQKQCEKRQRKPMYTNEAM